MGTDDEERQAQERDAAEQRSFKKLTWPGWGTTGQESLCEHLDEGVVVLYECLRCGALVAALGLHEQTMHPDDPLRESSRLDMEEFVMPSPGHREIREMPMKRDDVLTSTVSFDCRTVDGDGVAKVIARIREVFKRGLDHGLLRGFQARRADLDDPDPLRGPRSPDLR
jgi:hypothetical protein